MEKTSFVEAQKMIESLYNLPRTEEVTTKINDAYDYKKRSYHYSLDNNLWVDCDFPLITPSNHWDYGWSNSYLNKDGSSMVWHWKQPKEENFIYSLTEQITFENKIKKLKKNCSRKPLVLDPESLIFFNELKKYLESTITQKK